MGVIGKVESLWRYPVKSMRGEELDEAFVGFSGVYGDRLFAFHASDGAAGFPYMTGRVLGEMLCYQPRFRHPDKATNPPNLTEAANITPGINPLYGDQADLMVDVEVPSGDLLAIDQPELLDMLGTDSRSITLLRSDRAMTDCRPLSMFGMQSLRQLGKEIGTNLDKRRFRANIYVDFEDAEGFSEDALVGQSLQIGPKVVISILERDPRCKMISLDPDTGEHSPETLRQVSAAHEGMAGVYGAVLVEGMIRNGDEVVI
jgi:hypothetical protein